MKKPILIGGVVLLIILLGAAGTYIYTNNKPKPETVFRNYVNNSVKLNKFGLQQTANGTGSELVATGGNDIDAKKFIINAPVKCTIKYDNEEVKINSTFQQENGKAYLRLDDISGKYTNSEGTSYDLSKVYSKVKGQWYVVINEDKGVQSLLDSGLAAYNSIFLAPAYDAEKITNEIINTKVFSYKSANKDGSNYSFQFVADRNAYASFLKNNFPNLSNADLVLDNIFDDKSVLESTLVLTKEGQFVEEKLQATNLCIDIASTFIGEDAKGLAKELASTSVSKNFDTLNIPAVTGSKPIEKMQEDMTL